MPSVLATSYPSNPTWVIGVDARKPKGALQGNSLSRATQEAAMTTDIMSQIGKKGQHCSPQLHDLLLLMG
jgi:hypothetical protein